eukprot:3294207-Ditylum_brightwellii.AAC.1
MPKKERKVSCWKQINFDDEIELGKQIGGGGSGIIYKGWYRGKPVALKTLFDPSITLELREEFINELLIMSQMHHPNIVNFFGASTIPPNLFFVMELCQCSLFDLLHKRQEPLSLQRYLETSERVRLCLETARGMQYLHSRCPCVVHRDLKSHNILLGSDGTARLCDFGL